MNLHPYKINFYNKDVLFEIKRKDTLDFDAVILLEQEFTGKNYHDLRLGDIFKKDDEFLLVAFNSIDNNEKTTVSSPFVFHVLKEKHKFLNLENNIKQIYPLNKKEYTLIANVLLENNYYNGFYLHSSLTFSTYNKKEAIFLNNIFTTMITIDGFNYFIKPNDGVFFDNKKEKIEYWQNANDLFTMIKHNNNKFDICLELLLDGSYLEMKEDKVVHSIVETGDLFIYNGKSQNKKDSYFFIAIDELNDVCVIDQDRMQLSLTDLNLKTLNQYRKVDKNSEEYLTIYKNLI